jgi:hypothetical protein
MKQGLGQRVVVYSRKGKSRGKRGGFEKKGPGSINWAAADRPLGKRMLGNRQ